MSASTCIILILVVLLLLVGRSWWRNFTANEVPATQTADAPPKLDVFKRLEPIERFARWYYVTVAVLIGIFSLSLAARNGQISWGALADLLLGASVSFVVAVASTAIGCFLGFLFGIPKSLQRGAAPAAPTQPASGTPAAATAANGSGSAGRTSAPAFGTNTSLEEISDWLTKIIIGLGLVQFQTFLTYLYNASLFAASFIAQSDLTIDTTQQGKLEYQSGLASPFLFAIILACLVASCLFAYLETRTRLAQLFLEQKKDEDGVPREFRDTLKPDSSSDTLRNYLWPAGTYDDDRRKTLNNLLAELGISWDVRVILSGADSAEFRKSLIALAEKKSISLTAPPAPKPQT